MISQKDIRLLVRCWTPGIDGSGFIAQGHRQGKRKDFLGSAVDVACLDEIFFNKFISGIGFQKFTT